MFGDRRFLQAIIYRGWSQIAGFEVKNFGA